MPPPRAFLSIPRDWPLHDELNGAKPLRVLQFNMLADGLSGLRADLGAFSRAKADEMAWANRKQQLLHEILQYDPDVITLQECDHYYDFFLPSLSPYGYDGLFAPKPASACLEVSDNSDGCAIFFKQNRLRVVSSETITFALAPVDVRGDDDATVEKDDDRQVRAQNQVALIAVCEFLGLDNEDRSSSSSSPASTTTSPPPLVISTTHLKAAKTSSGERYRYREVMQLLGAVERAVLSLGENNKPAVLLTGDLNAAPSERDTGYQALAYAAVKAHPLGFRSTLNDDLVNAGLIREEDIWTTWKSRFKKGRENVSRSCIDYILYVPSSGLRALRILSLYANDEVGEQFLPNNKYPSDHLAICADFVLLKRP